MTNATVLARQKLMVLVGQPMLAKHAYAFIQTIAAVSDTQQQCLIWAQPQLLAESADCQSYVTDCHGTGCSRVHPPSLQSHNWNLLC